MKITSLACVSILALGLSLTARADSSTTLTGVHNCCKSCTKGINEAVTKGGGTAKVDKGTVVVTAADDAAVKKAVASLVDAGYFGKGAEAPAPASDVKAKSVTVEGLHICCPKCVDAFNKAAAAAPGVTKTNAAKGATSVVVEGDVSPKALVEALNAAGFSAKVK